MIIPELVANVALLSDEDLQKFQPEELSNKAIVLNDILGDFIKCNASIPRDRAYWEQICVLAQLKRILRAYNVNGLKLTVPIGEHITLSS